MKFGIPTVPWIGLWAAICVGVTASAPQEADFSIHSLSLRFGQATAKMIGVSYTLELTTGSTGAFEPANGELAVADSSANTTHVSRFRLNSDIYLEPITGILYLDIPMIGDTNKDGLNDFFDPSLPVASLSTAGTLEDDLVGETGTVSATWTREAGNPKGVCRMTVQTSYLMATFNHPFEVLVYAGKLHYVPAAGTVNGDVDLRLWLDDTQRLAGPIALKKVDTSNLLLQAGGWTNVTGQVFDYLDTYSGETIHRTGTNYTGYLDVTDGNLDTGYADYVLWLLVIRDGNDSNRNGIPDLSDSATARVPQIALKRNGAKLQLSISGSVGRLHHIESTSRLAGGSWTNIAAFNLTNDPHVVDLDTPATNTVFWRVGTP